MQSKNTIVPFLAALFLAPTLGCDDGDDSPMEMSDTDASETDASDTESPGTDGSDSEDTEAMTNDDPLGIIGEYTDDFGGGHSISMTQWVQNSDFGTFTYNVGSFDNDAMWVAAEDADNAGSFTRFDWTVDDSGQQWFCQAVFEAASEEEAIDAPASDPADPATAGCGMMFPWSQLNPA